MDHSFQRPGPLINPQLEGEPPKGPHLALYTDKSGLALAIPVGAHISIVEDPKRVDMIFPLILVAVSHRRLVFRCACMQPDCTRVFKAPLTAEGWHPKRKHSTAQGIP